MGLILFNFLYNLEKYTLMAHYTEIETDKPRQG